ncbi:MAG TPA: efflux RND transporter periplasmic adaptor subunit [Planctomycetota bacterium]|nr:efflux RND transporter periplasmic adaptor subunit [Planctomycetota bacterium]
MKAIAWSVALLLLATGGYLLWSRSATAAAVTTFRTAQVSRGSVVASIDATGTVEPEEVVDVGAQVAGMILAFGTDKDGKPIDYGSEVEAGTVLARIDDSLYAADAAQAKAQLVSAQAGVTRARADLQQLQAKLVQATADWQRAKQLDASEILAQSGLDAAQEALDVGKANVAVGEAAIAQAEAGVQLAEAALKRAERNLGYCVIRSPVRGVIIDRRVNIGQTVVSSLNAPSLFLIAKDLEAVQVWAAVNESEISSVRAGQAVRFGVDAAPGRLFHGEVRKVRLNASMTQNVVTYTVEIAAENPDGLLLPYLTANVKFVVDEHKGVLLVPNAALAWSPAGQRPDAAGTARIWTPDADRSRPIAVKVGLSDGVCTEVEGEGLVEDLPVIVGETKASPVPAVAASGTNPFTPQIGRNRRGM